MSTPLIKPPSILFLEPRFLREFDEIDPRLRKLFYDVVYNLWPEKVPVTITSIYRTSEENVATGGHPFSVHTVKPTRGMDLRIWQLTPQDIARIPRALNEKYVYDPRRPTMPVCYSRPHGSGPHFHLQTHPGTRLRLEDDPKWQGQKDS